MLHQHVCILQQYAHIVLLIFALHMLDFVLERVTQIMECGLVRMDFLVVAVFSR